MVCSAHVSSSFISICHWLNHKLLTEILNRLWQPFLMFSLVHNVFWLLLELFLHSFSGKSLAPNILYKYLKTINSQCCFLKVCYSCRPTQNPILNPGSYLQFESCLSLPTWNEPYTDVCVLIIKGFVLWNCV